ncbi:MAG: M24 family metallopeptidase [Pseudomonadota bacterium]
MRTEADLPFSLVEYDARLQQTRRRMERDAIDVLIVTDPSNIAWLSGYDGWSFYVHQCLVVFHDRAPMWFGREQDANGARRTMYLPDDCIASYPDEYVQASDRHPMDILGGLLRDAEFTIARVGVEMDNYYFSAACFNALRTQLPSAIFHDATGLVNWARAIKSPQEIAYMRSVGALVSHMHAVIRDVAVPGIEKHRLVAEIYRAGIAGLPAISGDYPAIVPLLPSGRDASAPHLTWVERRLQRGEATFFEIAGCHRRYHCPQSRTIYFGDPPAEVRRAERASLEAIDAMLSVARPGAGAADVAVALARVLKRFDIVKTSRSGYSVGMSYPPDWGERTISIRETDDTELVPGMTFHFIPALWFDDWGIEITETVVITERGAEPLADTPRELTVKG